jgi:AcrR family transcriptional regulator
MTPRAEDAAPARGRGRRPGGVDTRAAIVDAARRSFATHGYDKASLRGIARQAGVDPALVHHYFDGKAALFAETLSMPVDPARLVERIVAGGPDGVGRRVIETFLSVWEPGDRRDALVALVRSAMTSEDAARVLREFLGREVFGRVAGAFGSPDVQLRGGLVASQIVGLVVMRYVLRMPGIAEASPEELVERLAPVIEHHLLAPAPAVEAVEEVEVAEVVYTPGPAE